ncbi:transglutaminase family protein [Angustibacter luteus]|uniref:TransglutaminaseTgpA domain-containing protein n=1 Tax=Angustibacter luteus TaxID=658456 RepID=A0ABW1JK24_9ACTN
MSAPPGPRCTDPALRIAVVALGVCAALGVGVSHLIEPAAAVGTVVALLLAAFVAAHGGHRGTRTAVGFACLGAATILGAATGGFAVSTLTLVALWLLVTAQLCADTLRELLFAAMLAMALLVLSAGLAPTLVLAVPWLLGWAAAVSTLVLAVRARAAQSTTHVRARTDEGSGASSSPWGAIGLAFGISVLLALVAALVVPMPQGAAASRMDALSRLAGRPPANLPSRSAAQFQSGEMDMRLRGDLPDTVIGYVAPDGPRYWRATTLDDYDGAVWRSGGGQPPGRSFDAGSRGTYVASALADQPSPGTGALREDHVELTGRTSGFLLAPGHPTNVRPDDGSQVLVAAGSAMFLVGGATGPLGFAQGPVSYDVTSVVTPKATSVAGTSVTVGQGPAGDWLQLPSTVTQRTHDLALKITAGATTRGEQVALVEHYLSTTYRYRLDSPVPPPDQDAVDHFLFDARTGFCEQFAAAEVVLLRTLGVPARVATGYAFPTVENGRGVLRAKQAHAWAEVWQPGSGWLTSDATPPGEAATSSSSRLATALHRLMGSTRARWALAAGLLGLGGVVALVVLLVRRRRRRRALVPATADLDGLDPQQRQVVAAVSGLVAALRAAGRPSPPADTVTELAGRVPELRPRALLTAERTLYGRRPPPADLVDEAVRDIDTVALQIRTAAEEAGASRGTRI